MKKNESETGRSIYDNMRTGLTLESNKELVR